MFLLGILLKKFEDAIKKFSDNPALAAEARSRFSNATPSLINERDALWRELHAELEEEGFTIAAIAEALNLTREAFEHYWYFRRVPTGDFISKMKNIQEQWNGNQELAAKAKEKRSTVSPERSHDQEARLTAWNQLRPQFEELFARGHIFNEVNEFVGYSRRSGWFFGIWRGKKIPSWPLLKKLKKVPAEFKKRLTPEERTLILQTNLMCFFYESEIPVSLFAAWANVNEQTIHNHVGQNPPAVMNISVYRRMSDALEDLKTRQVSPEFLDELRIMRAVQIWKDKIMQQLINRYSAVIAKMVKGKASEENELYNEAILLVIDALKKYADLEPKKKKGLDQFVVSEVAKGLRGKGVRNTEFYGDSSLDRPRFEDRSRFEDSTETFKDFLADERSIDEDDRNLLIDLRRKVDQLAPEERNVFLDHYLHGIPLDIIAGNLGRSVLDIRADLQRIRADLQSENRG